MEPSCRAPRKGARVLGNNQGMGVTPMDAEARRRQLAAAINRVAAGDQAALRLVYAETSAKLFGVCLRILGERSEAEDVLQEVYLTVWRKAASFEESVASPITWLVAIARNRSIDRLRAGGASRASLPIEAAAEVPDPGLSAVERSRSARIRRGSGIACTSSRSASRWRSVPRFSTGSPMTSLRRRRTCRSAP